MLYYACAYRRAKCNTKECIMKKLFAIICIVLCMTLVAGMVACTSANTTDNADNTAVEQSYTITVTAPAADDAIRGASPSFSLYIEDLSLCKTNESAYLNPSETISPDKYITVLSPPCKKAETTAPAAANGTPSRTVHRKAMPSGDVSNSISARPNKKDSAPYNKPYITVSLFSFINSAAL